MIEAMKQALNVLENKCEATHPAIAALRQAIQEEAHMKYETIGLCELKFKVDVAINHKFETQKLEEIQRALERTIEMCAGHNMVLGESTIELLGIKK